jgi:hypothetical protein
MRVISRSAIAVAASCSVLLAACGGGDGEPAPTAEGVYSGTLTGSGNNAFQLLMLENGEYWALYGSSSGGTFFVEGFVQGNVTYSGTSFNSTDSRDFGYDVPQSVSLSGSFSPGSNISGTVSASGASATFSGTPTPASTFDYTVPAPMATANSPTCGHPKFPQVRT